MVTRPINAQEIDFNIQYHNLPQGPGNNQEPEDKYILIYHNNIVMSQRFECKN